MPRNEVKHTDLRQGAEWTFIHRDGRRVLYLYDELLQPGGPGTDKTGGLPLSPTHALLNPATGKRAMVSEKWMREGPVAGGPHWVVGNEVEEALDRAA